MIDEALERKRTIEQHEHPLKTGCELKFFGMVSSSWSNRRGTSEHYIPVAAKIWLIRRQCDISTQKTVKVIIYDRVCIRIDQNNLRHNGDKINTFVLSSFSLFEKQNEHGGMRV